MIICRFLLLARTLEFCPLHFLLKELKTQTKDKSEQDHSDQIKDDLCQLSDHLDQC